MALNYPEPLAHPDEEKPHRKAAPPVGASSQTPPEPDKEVEPLPLVRVVIECNTFDFHVKEVDHHKRVTVIQRTDFSGTILESDFPNGDTSRIIGYAAKELSDMEVIDLVGAKLIKNWDAQEKIYPWQDSDDGSSSQKLRLR